MLKLLEFTDMENRPVYINPDTISIVKYNDDPGMAPQTQGMVRITCENGEIIVKEPMSKVVKDIEYGRDSTKP